MRKLLILIILAMVWVFGCNSNGELTLNGVTDSEFETVKKLRSGQYTLVSNQELTQLKHDAELGKGVCRYQTYRQGFRTWRLDTASGAVCLLLTTEQDWKKPETTAEGCSR